jgi:hypothetical protein
VGDPITAQRLAIRHPPLENSCDIDLEASSRKVPMTPTPDDLPFLVTHGPLVWKVTLACLVAFSLGLIRLLRQLRAARAARAELAGVDRGTEEHGVLRGTLGGPTSGRVATTLRAHRRGGEVATADWRSDEAWLDTARGRFRLDGPLRVVAGRHAHTARNGVPSAVTDDELHHAMTTVPWLRRSRLWPDSDNHSAIFLTVAPGDEVVVSGRIERGATPSTTDDGAAEIGSLRAWGTRPIEIAARRPRAPILRLALPATLLIVGLTAAVGWRAMVALGEQWMRRCQDAPRKSEPFELSGGHVCAFAAASPGQSDALRDVFDRLDKTRHASERWLRQLVGLNVLMEGCGARWASGEAGRGTASRKSAAAENLMRHGRYEDGAAHAARCGAERTRYSALMVQGRFEEAAGIQLTGDSHRPVHREIALIATGRWQAAAELLESRAGRVQIDQPDDEVREVAEVAALQQRCLAELLRHHGGDAGAASRLRALAAGRHGRHCKAALSEIAALDERRRLLDDASAELLEMQGAGKHWVDLEWEALVAPLRWAAGLPAEVRELPGEEPRWWMRPEVLKLALPDMSSDLTWTYAWLASAAVAHAPRDATPDARATLLGWLTASQVLDGDIAAARKTAREAALEAPRLELPEDRLVVAVLPAVVALYSTETELVFDFDRDGRKSGVACDLPRDPCWHKRLSRLLMRRGDLVDPRRDYGFNDPDAVAAAQQGDGRALMEVPGAWFEGDMMAILPRIVKGRQEIITQIIWGQPFPDPYASWEDEPQFPWSSAIHAFRRRALLRVAGEIEEAERWDAIFRRFDEVFSDRRRLVPLIMCVLIDSYRRGLGDDVVPE